jgi:poly-gamma-glutamate capsule biosynthesis protein CapA/YwtB (metallophosphatase superfamily)
LGNQERAHQKTCAPAASALTAAIERALIAAALVLGFIYTSAGHARESVTLAFGGDVMLGRGIDKIVRAKGPRYIWGDVLPLLRGADAALVNLESVIATPGERFPNRVFYFRATPETGRALVEAGIDYVSLANNHAVDFQVQGLMQTIAHLDRMEITHAGAGRNRQVAAAPALFDVSGIKVAVVAFADHFREYAAGPDSPGINWISLEDFAPVRNAILDARAVGADLVIFSIHWGPNMRDRPSDEFIAFARSVIDAGADIFHGHSAHVFQGIEVYKGKVIFYDTGDLIDDYAVDSQLRNDQQLLFVLKANRERIEEVELVPLVIREMQVNRARGDDFAEIHERIARLSAEFGTTIEREQDRLRVTIPAKRLTN